MNWKEIKRRGETWEEADMRNKQEDWKGNLIKEIDKEWSRNGYNFWSHEDKIKMAIQKTEEHFKKDGKSIYDQQFLDIQCLIAKQEERQKFADWLEKFKERFEQDGFCVYCSNELESEVKIIEAMIKQLRENGRTK